MTKEVRTLEERIARVEGEVYVIITMNIAILLLVAIQALK